MDINGYKTKRARVLHEIRVEIDTLKPSKLNRVLLVSVLFVAFLVTIVTALVGLVFDSLVAIISIPIWFVYMLVDVLAIIMWSFFEITKKVMG